MSRLTVWEAATGREVLRTEDAGAIAAALREIGVRFERWEGVAVPEGATNEQVLEAYRPYLDRLMGETGAGTADVVSLTPDHPQAAAMRAKFLNEHIHTEDEVRFFVRGSGDFVMHVDGKVWDAHCVQGDLISVPANTRHWFDAGESPHFTALRVFSDQSGWVAHFTGDDIAARFPVAA
ncbi:1,2-dihydroxy-3-keto-5-methylthiopentene dioxygenase [Paracraurococcus ruber]|uniref:Acireductone dioxygenase n=1 Tax=Paracraurococcus ruber TaxID=77675 RepID=A0ABS1CW80_9PROT|nr:acireductone dioxygenase [Paracraurococcus ruber]MBK1658297.1 acireductone dioxygenase [Paracraurococcus ruber]TDG30933.1 acireductone dioxygenase [Paracraurococcus ruber]